MNTDECQPHEIVSSPIAVPDNDSSPELVESRYGFDAKTVPIVRGIHLGVNPAPGVPTARAIYTAGLIAWGWQGQFMVKRPVSGLPLVAWVFVDVRNRGHRGAGTIRAEESQHGFHKERPSGEVARWSAMAALPDLHSR